MGFKDFVEQTVSTKQGVYKLNRGIPHIEDLPPRKFLEVVENLAVYTITEKLDGANLVFGFDADGTMYTSRNAKGGNKHYTPESYPNRPANNGFRQAHNALMNVEGTLRGKLDCGESVEMEILYGRQPNAIVYGSNHIAFLRMVPGSNGEMPDQSKLIELKGALEGFTTHVTSNITTTRDGMDLYETSSTETWKFAVAPTVDPVKFVAVKLENLESYKQWLKTKLSSGFTNESLASCNLNKIKKADIPEGITKKLIKEKREVVREKITEWQTLFKEAYLDSVLRKIKPAFRDVQLEGPERNIGVEGVVLRHPETGEQVKIVDKKNFTIINQFNHAIRTQIRSTSGVNNRFEATVGRDIDIYTELLREFEKSLGVEGLGRLTSIKRIIRKHAGNTLTETIGNFTAAFKTQDVKILQEEITSAIAKSLWDLAFCHGRYLLERYSYTLTLSNGRTIHYTDEINKRTELMFAETRKELKDMRSQVEFAETLEDIAQALYAKQLNSL